MIDHRINQSVSAAHFLHRFKASKSSSRKKMDLDHENVRSAINEDRLSSLPDKLIHQILLCIDSKFPYNFQELNVVIYPKKHHEFPPCLFSSNKSLKHFTLRTFFLAPCLIIHKTSWDFLALTTLFTNSDFKLINLIAPKLENLTVINCSIEKLNAPPLLSSLSEYGFHSLNKGAIYLSIYRSRKPYEEEIACKTIDMLREVHSARFLTLGADVVECISSFPELISHHPSPFRNLICVNIDSGMRKDAYKVKMSTEARNFLLENSPSATFIMELPEAPNFESQKDEVLTIFSKKDLIRSLLEKFPKRQRTEIVAGHSCQLEESEEQIDPLLNEHLTSKRIIFDAYEKSLSDNISTFLDVSSSNIPLVSRPSSSSFSIIPTLSTSNINSMP